MKASVLLRHPLPWILLFAAILRASGAGYLRGSDDLSYARAAADLLEGRYAPERHFHELRIGVIAPTALSFAAFGITPGAGLAWPWAASILSIAALYVLVHARAGAKVAVLAALLLSVCTQHVLSGGELFPDSPLTFWILCAACAFDRGLRATAPARHFAFAAACLYAATATRIEALRLVPAFAVWEAFEGPSATRRRRIAAFAGVYLGLLAADTAFFAALTGTPLVRLNELTAVKSWEASSAAADMGLSPMLKSLASPFGAFGLLVPVAATGAVLCLRARRAGPAVGFAAWMLGSTLILAGLYRLADGRLYTPLSPWVAWLAAEALGRLPGRRAVAAAAGLALAGSILAHARMPLPNARLFAELDRRLEADPRPAWSDVRTAGLFAVYYPHRGMRVADGRPPSPAWLVDNVAARQIDRALYGRETFPVPEEAPAFTLEGDQPGIPGLRELGALARRIKGSGSAAARLRVYRLD